MNKKFFIIFLFIFTIIVSASGNSKEPVQTEKNKQNTNGGFNGTQIVETLNKAVGYLKKLVDETVKNKTTGVKVSQQSVEEIAAAVNRHKNNGDGIDRRTSDVENWPSKDQEKKTLLNNTNVGDDNESGTEVRQGGDHHYYRGRNVADLQKPHVLPDPLIKYGEWRDQEIDDELIIRHFITQKNGLPRCHYIKNPYGGDKVFVVVCDEEHRSFFPFKKKDRLITDFKFEFEVRSCKVKSDAAVFVILSRTANFSKINFGNTVFGSQEMIVKKLSPNKAPQKLEWKAEIGGSHNEILYCYVVVAVNEVLGGKVLYYKIFPIKFLTQYTEEFYNK